MPRQINPFRQGDADNLCGIYAIINVCYALCPQMNGKEAERLFSKLVKEIGRKRSDPLQIVWRGIDGSLMRHLLAVALGSIERKHSISVEMSRPFAKTPVKLVRLVQRLEEHTAEQGVALILVRIKSAHWTMVKRVTRKKLHLFDSKRRGYLPIKLCTVNPTQKRYRIHVREVMLLRKVQPEG
jgi:hypothetical protein